MFTDDKFKFSDDTITVWSWNPEKYYGELTDDMVQRCKIAKEKIESWNSQLKWFEIRWRSNYDNWFYLSSRLNQREWEEEHFECCKDWGSVFFHTETWSASTSWWPRQTIYRDGHIEKSEYDREKSQWTPYAYYKISRLDPRIEQKEWLKKHSARMRRSSPQASGSMHFEFELPVTILDFTDSKRTDDWERKYD